MPTTGQLGLLILSILLFAAGGLVSVLRRGRENWALRVAAKQFLYWGMLAAVAVLGWHSAQRGSWLPLEDNFDALIWLGLLIAGFVLYVQRANPIVGIDLFLLPVVIVILVAAAVFGRTKPHQYLPTTWLWVHLATAFGGAVAFAIAGAAGAMYLVTTAKLRRRNLESGPGPNFGSLEGLEHFTRVAVTLGFALLTIGLIMGFVQVGRGGGGGGTTLGSRWFLRPKVVLSVCVWVVYALVLHAPINPSFRGRKTAMLSIFGLVLMIGTLIAVQFIPSGGAH